MHISSIVSNNVTFYVLWYCLHVIYKRANVYIAHSQSRCFCPILGEFGGTPGWAVRLAPPVTSFMAGKWGQPLVEVPAVSALLSVRSQLGVSLNQGLSCVGEDRQPCRRGLLRAPSLPRERLTADWGEEGKRHFGRLSLVPHRATEKEPRHWDIGLLFGGLAASKSSAW